MASIGDRQMSYLMNPLGQGDRAINGGNSYANADTLDAARAYAARVIDRTIEGVEVRAVSITGRMMVLSYASWREASHSEGARFTHEIVRSQRPATLTPADELRICYFTTILDYPEWVHERRTDGSCRCGQHGADIRY